jgi:hypothetical protein
VSFTINADDPRTIRAIEIAAGADEWLSGRNSDGVEVFGVPSQSGSGHYYMVTLSSCDCPDATRVNDSEQRACKHILAVQLHHELVIAQRYQSRVSPRRFGHLTLVPRT